MPTSSRVSSYLQGKIFCIKAHDYIKFGLLPLNSCNPLKGFLAVAHTEIYGTLFGVQRIACLRAPMVNNGTVGFFPSRYFNGRINQD